MKFNFVLPNFDSCKLNCRGIQTFSYTVNAAIDEVLGVADVIKVLNFCGSSPSYESSVSKVFPAKSINISDFIFSLFKSYSRSIFDSELFERSPMLKKTDDYFENIVFVNGEPEISNIDNLFTFHSNSRDFYFTSRGSTLRAFLQKHFSYDKDFLFPRVNSLKAFCLKEGLNYDELQSYVSLYNTSKVYYLDVVFMNGNKPVTFSPRIIKSLYFLYDLSLNANMLFTIDVSANILTATLEEHPKFAEPKPDDLLSVRYGRDTKSFVYRKGPVPFIHHYKNRSALGWSAPKEKIFKGDEYLDEQLSSYGLSSNDIPVLDLKGKNSYGSRSDYKSWKSKKIKHQWQKHKRPTSKVTKGTHYYFGAVPEFDLESIYKDMHDFSDSSDVSDVSVESDVSDVSEGTFIKELEQYGIDYWLDLFENR